MGRLIRIYHKQELPATVVIPQSDAYGITTVGKNDGKLFR